MANVREIPDGDERLVWLSEALLRVGYEAPSMIVGMIEYRGSVLVATERHVFRLDAEGMRFEPIVFASPLTEVGRTLPGS